eukprot:10908759-Karenia_brevis.AAC.1
MSAFSAPASSSQQNISGYNFSAPSGWTSEDKSDYIASTIEFREPQGFAADEFLGAWPNAA